MKENDLIIKLDPVTEEKLNKSNLKEFLFSYFENFNQATYLVEDSEFTNPQCDLGKRRSFEDLYSLCKYYFPDNTIKDLAVALLELQDEKKTYMCSCPQIQRTTFKFYDQRYANARPFDWPDIGTDYYTIKKIKKLANYKEPVRPNVSLDREQTVGTYTVTLI
jgi:hypothetical protein